jgi:hypothetical protein
VPKIKASLAQRRRLRRVPLHLLLKSVSFSDTGPEPISKMWIRVHGKARIGEKAEHTR